MLEALIVTLREGVEAALVVGIIVVFLRREGYGRYLMAVWAGIGAAVAGSLAGAWLLYRWAVNQEAFEGVLYVASALIVGSMVVWMWRHARHLAGEVKGSLGRLVGDDRPVAVATGLFLFTFLMVVREGIETALFLSAVSLSTGGLLTALGALLGLAAAVAFGVLFVRGSLKVDLPRFFRITGIALLIFVAQLLLNGYHELSEAGWLPASPTTMGIVGPLVRNQFFFVVAVVLLPLLLLLVPGRDPGRSGAASGPLGRQAEAPPGGQADRVRRRLALARERSHRRARTVGGTLGIAILACLGLGFVYGNRPRELSAAIPLEPRGGEVRIPIAGMEPGTLHRYVVALAGAPVRFIAVRLGEEVATAFDACLICGSQGYLQEGTEIVCRHCGSAIVPATIGQPGGCNPMPLGSRVEGGELVIAAGDLAAAAGRFVAAGGRVAAR